MSEPTHYHVRFSRAGSSMAEIRKCQRRRTKGKGADTSGKCEASGPVIPRNAAPENQKKKTANSQTAKAVSEPQPSKEKV